MNKSRMYIKNIGVIKAWMCGFLAGDGTVKSYLTKTGGREYDIAFYPDTKDLAKFIQKSIKKIYKKEVKIRPHHQKKKCLVIKFKSREIYLDFSSVANFGTKLWNVPFEFLDTQEKKIVWIMGFFDAEAYVNLRNRSIQVQSINKRGLQEVQKLLALLGIKATIYVYKRKQKNWCTNYLLEVLPKENVLKYYELIGFESYKKQQRLIKLRNNFLCQGGGKRPQSG